MHTTFILFLLFCLPGKNCFIKSTENKQSTKITINQVYILGEKPEKDSSEEILRILKSLSQGILNKNLSVILNFVHKDRGVYLDLKGLWKYEDLQAELEKDNSYFEIYFFNHDKLEKEKGSQDVMTVRELLIASKGIRADLFFEDANSCEVKLQFLANKNLAYNLNNPHFIKIDGKWYLYRMF